jgi:hypothetical protein
MQSLQRRRRIWRIFSLVEPFLLFLQPFVVLNQMVTAMIAD